MLLRTTLIEFSVTQENSDFCVIRHVLGTTQQTTTTSMAILQKYQTNLLCEI